MLLIAFEVSLRLEGVTRDVVCKKRRRSIVISSHRD